MNRYYKLQNGDIFDNQTRTIISRERLLEILIFGKIDEKMVSGDNDNELDGNKDSILD